MLKVHDDHTYIWTYCNLHFSTRQSAVIPELQNSVTFSHESKALIYPRQLDLQM